MVCWLLRSSKGAAQPRKKSPKQISINTYFLLTIHNNVYCLSLKFVLCNIFLAERVFFSSRSVVFILPEISYGTHVVDSVGQVQSSVWYVLFVYDFALLLHVTVVILLFQVLAGSSYIISKVKNFTHDSLRTEKTKLNALRTNYALS